MYSYMYIYVCIFIHIFVYLSIHKYENLDNRNHNGTYIYFLVPHIQMTYDNIIFLVSQLSIAHILYNRVYHICFIYHIVYHI